MKRRPTAFVTGVAGFAGSYLAEELLGHGFRLYGTRYKGESVANLQSIKKDIELLTLDILNVDKCRRAIGTIRPDYIFHLAAMASVGRSFSTERLTYRTNIEGTVNLLDAALGHRRLKSVVFVSSADCFGSFSPKNKTLTEAMPLNPISPYGISKAAAERTALYYHRQHNLPVTVARSFNHTGPRQTPQYVVPAFASQIAKIEAGSRRAILRVGDLSARRDLSDVRDIVRGYYQLATGGQPGQVYHLCSGRAVSMQTILEKLLAGSKRPVSVVKDKSRMRQADIPILRGSNRKATRDVGYRSQRSLESTLSDTLDYWRDRVHREKKH